MFVYFCNQILQVGFYLLQGTELTWNLAYLNNSDSGDAGSDVLVVQTRSSPQQGIPQLLILSVQNLLSFKYSVVYNTGTVNKE